MAVWLATAGGVGYAPWAPGTWGSAVGLLLFFPLASLGSFPYLLATLVLTLLGVWASARAEAHFGRHDDGRIVIDEVAGQLVTLTPLVLATRVTDELSTRALFLLVVTAFVAFRVLDIWKPGPIRRVEQRFGETAGARAGVGVMADDLMAGVLGAVIVALALWLVADATTVDLVSLVSLVNLGNLVNLVSPGGTG